MLNKHIATVEEMEQFAASFVEHLDLIKTIYFAGDLGAGKTSFVRGLLHALGYSGTVKSPTFTLVEPYNLQGRDIYHFDLYRVNDPEELEAIGIRDYFEDSAMCLVEWPEKAKEFLDSPDVLMKIDYNGQARTVSLISGSETGKLFIAKLL